jgi:hypothetical protein
MIFRARGRTGYRQPESRGEQRVKVTDLTEFPTTSLTSRLFAYFSAVALAASRVRTPCKVRGIPFPSPYLAAPRS